MTHQSTSPSGTHSLLLRKVSGIAEFPLACEVALAEALPCLGPSLAAAARELELPGLALLCAPCQHAVGAHEGVAHDRVEAVLPVTRSFFVTLAGFHLGCILHPCPELCANGHLGEERENDGGCDNLHCRFVWLGSWRKDDGC